jgi:hypothetical protein
MNITPGPWKILATGNQWGIAQTKAARGDDDICMGSQYHPEWKANAKAIAALPDLIEAATGLLEALVADVPQAADTAKVKALRAALKKAL